MDCPRDVQKPSTDRRLLLSAFVILLIPACTGLIKKMPPHIQVADIQPGEIKALEAHFQVTLRVINPNDTPLAIEGLSCDLKINGQRIASGVSGTSMKIPAYESDTLEVSMYSSMVNMVGSVIGLLQQARQTAKVPETIGYELSGRLDLGGFSPPVPFSTGGELSLRDLTLPR